MAALLLLFDCVYAILSASLYKIAFMENRNISLLVTKFFEGDLSGKIRCRFGKWFINDELHYEKQEALYDIWENYTVLSDEHAAEELRKVKKRIARYENSRRRALYRRMAGVAAVFLLVVFSSAVTFVFTNRRSVAVVKEPELVEHFVPRGERKHIMLSDSSEVWLNAGSLLVYEKNFSGNTRTLFLNGEANFRVAPMPEKPFIVKTEYMDITAVGTVFNVHSYPEASKSTTILESGKVQINMKQNDMHSVVILSPNEQLVYDKIADEFTTKKVEASKKMQWTQGFLVFQGNTFDEVVQEIERTFQITVRYDANKFRGRLFTLRFSPDEGINQVFEILKEVGNLNYKIRENVVYVN
jgi:ferric-dicitrate binding protein FerR (iron transport regulator)